MSKVENFIKDDKKMKQHKVIGANYYIEELDKSMVSQNYVEWMNDPKVNEYMETRHYKHTMDSVLKFVNQKNKSVTEFLFGIFEKKKERHIGNIKVGPTSKEKKVADISYFIGERDYWGKGAATEAISLIIEFSFKKLKLKKLYANTYIQNKASIQVLVKNNFIFEKTKKMTRVKDNKLTHYTIFSLTNNK